MQTFILDIENPYQPITIDRNVVYFIDVSRISSIQIFSSIIFNKQSYIHSKVFLLTIGRDRQGIIKTISKYQIRHCFLFQQSSHVVSEFQ
jgi:hypothetical protein